MSYYGYVKREKDSTVDWKAITGNISKELTRVTTDRANKREELEQSSRDHMAAADSVETGSLKSMNDLAMDVANKQKQFGYAVNTLLKSGDISPNDFSRIMQTQMENVKNFSSVAKSVQSKYAEDMERFNAVTTSAAEKAATMRKYESFDPASNMYTIDPRTGLAVMTKIDENGNPIQGKKGSIPIQSLSAMMEFKMDAVDAPKMFSDVATKFADFTKVSGFSTITDARQNTEFFNDAKKSYIDSFVADKNTFVSILSDFYGYEITDDPDADPKKFIIMDLSKGYPEFTVSEELEQEGRGKIDSTLETMIGRDEKRVYPTPPSTSGGSSKPDEKSVIGNMKNIYSGTPDQMRAALSFFQGLNQDVVDMVRTPTGLEIKKSDGSVVPIPMTNPDGSPKGIDIFIEEAANQLTKGLFKDVNKAMKQAGITGQESYNPASARFTVRQKPTVGELLSKVDEFLAPKINPDRLGLEASSITDYINSSLSNLGVVATKISTGPFSSDKVEIKIPGAVGIEPLQINSKNSGTSKVRELNKLVDYVKKALATKYTGNEEELLNMLGGAPTSSVPPPTQGVITAPAGSTGR